MRAKGFAAARSVDAGGTGREKKKNPLLPDFFVIGAMKSASTSLYFYLEQHPQIFLPARKEPEYFSFRYASQDDYKWYQALYEAAKPGQLLGDCSTGYSRGLDERNIPERIAMQVPSAKIIYLLRNPVERAWSHYIHRMNERISEGKPVLDFDRAVRELPDIIDAGLYCKCLRAYLEYFPREQVKVFILDELLADPERHSEELDQFLNVPHIRGRTFQRANAAGQWNKEKKVTAWLQELEKSMLGRVLKRLLPRSLRSRIRQAFRSSRWVRAIADRKARTVELPKRPPKEIQSWLFDRYREEMLALQELLGRPVPSSWLWAEQARVVSIDSGKKYHEAV
ncbi:sulfotransferase family protein [Microbulbifer sediminum]|uniref:sulfotransferase family protein n=1 Tax=Microbulbifer sediminum TaxID=2904250 RepID=UPI001F269ABC|nr:sulfotransferase [Microbulbifer sediminum]